MVSATMPAPPCQSEHGRVTPRHKKTRNRRLGAVLSLGASVVLSGCLALAPGPKDTPRPTPRPEKPIYTPSVEAQALTKYYADLEQDLLTRGLLRTDGGGPETPEEHAHFGTIDALTGHCACVALGAALERLRLTGKGGIARASLAAAGEMIQAQFMYDFDGRLAFDEPSGREARGWGPFYRCYAAADRWMFFAAPTERETALARVPELSDLVGSDTDMEAALSSRFAQRPAAHWARAFAGGSAGVTPLGSLHDTRDEGLHLESDGGIDICKATFRAVRHDHHPMGRWVDLVAPNAVRAEKAQITIPGPAPKYGQNTRTILAGLGYDDAEIQNMIDTGAASESWSERYLPE